MEDNKSWVGRTKFSHTVLRSSSSRERIYIPDDERKFDHRSKEARCSNSNCNSVASVSLGTVSGVSSLRYSVETGARNVNKAPTKKSDFNSIPEHKDLILDCPLKLESSLKISHDLSSGNSFNFDHGQKLSAPQSQVSSYSESTGLPAKVAKFSLKPVHRSKSPLPSLNIPDFLKEAKYSSKRFSTPPPRRSSGKGRDQGKHTVPRAHGPHHLSLSLIKGYENLKGRRDNSRPSGFEYGTRVAASDSSAEWMIDRSQLYIGHKFASGAYSKLYYGKYKEKPVAIKFIRQPDDAESNDLAARLEKQFTREVAILSHLYHRNVIKLVGACKNPPAFCIITEYLPGGSLRVFLHKPEHKCLPLERLLSIALDIARGMEYIHSQGVIHRDLKPENIIFDDKFCAKIVDFGISCEDLYCDKLEENPGTYRWMAPEIIKQKPYNRKVDVYSFGLLLWEMVTGKIPYEDMTPVQAAFAVVDKNLRPVIPPRCPRALRALIEQCWALQPEKRPQFWQIVKVLEQFESVLAEDGSLDSIGGSTCPESSDQKNWFSNWLEKLKLGTTNGAVPSGPLPPKLL